MAGTLSSLLLLLDPLISCFLKFQDSHGLFLLVLEIKSHLLLGLNSGLILLLLLLLLSFHELDSRLHLIHLFNKIVSSITQVTNYI